MNFMTAWVAIKADYSNLKKNLDTSESLVAKTVMKMKAMMFKFGHGLHSMFESIFNKIKLYGTIAGVAITGLIYKTVQLASAANETRNKFEAVFGYLTREAEKWSLDFAKATGRATDEVQDWMARLQDTFVPLGFAREKAYELSKALVQLAVDVGSFDNAADSDVIENFTSALVGSTMAVRKYGILLTEVAMKEQMEKEGIKKKFEQLTSLEKVQLRFNMILASSRDAQGDAIRTADAHANTLKRFKSVVHDLGVTIGQMFMPTMTKWMQDGIKWLNEHKWAVIGWIAVVKEKFSAATDIVIQFFKAQGLWQSKVNIIWKVFLAGLSETIKTAVVMGYYGGKAIFDALKNGVLGGTEDQINKQAMARYGKAGGGITSDINSKTKYVVIESHPQPGGLSSRVTAYAPTDIEKFEAYRRQVEYEMLRKNTESAMEPAFRYADESWKRFKQQAGQEFGRVEGGDFNKWVESRWALADKLANAFIAEKKEQERVIIEFTPETARAIRVAERVKENSKAGAQSMRTQ